MVSEDRLIDLIERSVKVQEQGHAVQQALLENAKETSANLRSLNDTFAHHCTLDESKVQGMHDIKVELMKWIKYLAIALILALGGGGVLSQMGGIP